MVLGKNDKTAAPAVAASSTTFIHHFSLMSCVRDSSPSTSSSQAFHQQTEIDKNDVPKKRRFHPFRGLRKIFRRNKVRQSSSSDVVALGVDDEVVENVVPRIFETSAVVNEELQQQHQQQQQQRNRSRSTTQLSNCDHQISKNTGGMYSGHSVSHDSVFTGDQHSADELESSSSLSIQQIVIMPELMDAVRRRRGTSDDDEEDLGLPRSPDDDLSPTVDKSSSVPMKSQSLCSDSSLLSMISSEMDDESTFGCKTTSLSTTAAVTNELDVIEVNPPLSHSAARHKMAVRPKRTHATPKRRPMQQLSLPVTPEVNEESNLLSSESDKTVETRLKSASLPPGLALSTTTTTTTTTTNIVNLSRSRSIATNTDDNQIDNQSDTDKKKDGFFGRLLSRRRSGKKHQFINASNIRNRIDQYSIPPTTTDYVKKSGAAARQRIEPINLVEQQKPPTGLAKRSLDTSNRIHVTYFPSALDYTSKSLVTINNTDEHDFDYHDNVDMKFTSLSHVDTVLKPISAQKSSRNVILTARNHCERDNNLIMDENHENKDKLLKTELKSEEDGVKVSKSIVKVDNRSVTAKDGCILRGDNIKNIKNECKHKKMHEIPPPVSDDVIKKRKSIKTDHQYVSTIENCENSKYNHNKSVRKSIETNENTIVCDDGISLCKKVIKTDGRYVTTIENTNFDMKTTENEQKHIKLNEMKQHASVDDVKITQSIVKIDTFDVSNIDNYNVHCENVKNGHKLTKKLMNVDEITTTSDNDSIKLCQTETALNYSLQTSKIELRNKKVNKPTEVYSDEGVKKYKNSLEINSIDVVNIVENCNSPVEESKIVKNESKIDKITAVADNDTVKMCESVVKMDNQCVKIKNCNIEQKLNKTDEENTCKLKTDDGVTRFNSNNDSELIKNIENVRTYGKIINNNTNLIDFNNFVTFPPRRGQLRQTPDVEIVEDQQHTSKEAADNKIQVQLRKKTTSIIDNDNEPELMKVFARRSLKLGGSLEVIDGGKSRDSDKENELDSPPADKLPPAADECRSAMSLIKIDDEIIPTFKRIQQRKEEWEKRLAKQ